MALLFPRIHFPDDRLAVQVDDVRLSYQEFASRAGGFAEVLAGRALGPGARIGVVTVPHIDTTVAIVGALLAGVTVVPLSPKLGRTDWAHILSDAQPECLWSAAPLEREESILLIPSGLANPPERQITGAHALILYTSGTTGKPKGAILTDTQIAANIDGLAKAWTWTDQDNVVHALPLFHVHGLVLGLFGSLRVGGALINLSRFDTNAVARAFDNGATMLFAVPTMHHRLADAAESDAALSASLKKARLLISGSAALPVREQRRIKAASGRGVHERYGLTETLINCAVPASGPPMPGTVGFPVPGVELKLVDDQRQTLDVFDGTTIGEIAVRGDSLFAGYLNRPDATAAVMDDEGFFYTGDLATRDAEGAIRIVGRRSVDLIKTGGFKVGAGEVEACLLEAEGVAECAVVGVPDEDLGQRIEAFIVPRPGITLDATSLIQHVADELTPHKRPRTVHFVGELPRNAMGKVQKKRLLAE